MIVSNYLALKYLPSLALSVSLAVYLCACACACVCVCRFPVSKFASKIVVFLGRHFEIASEKEIPRLTGPERLPYFQRLSGFQPNVMSVEQ